MQQDLDQKLDHIKQIKDQQNLDYIKQVKDHLIKEGTFISERVIKNGNKKLSIIKFLDEDYKARNRRVAENNKRDRIEYKNDQRKLKTFLNFNNISKIGKYRYSINTFSVRRKMDHSNDDYEKLVWQYELFPVHGNNTKDFDKLSEVIKFIKDMLNGNVKFTHVCDCGCSWED